MNRRRQYTIPDVEPGLVWHPRTGPWLWVRLPGLHYDALTDQQRVTQLRLLRAVLATQEQGEAHLLVTRVPADLSVSAEPGTLWSQYSEGVAGYLAEVGYTERAAYLGVRLNRAQPWTITRGITNLIGRVAGGADRSRAETDRNSYRDQADSLVRKMAAAGLAVTPATDTELRRLCARPFWLTSDRTAESTADALVHRQWWRCLLAHPDGDLYATSLVVRRLDLAPFPGSEWLLPLPDPELDPDVSVRMLVVPPTDQTSALTKARDALKDQLANLGPRAADRPDLAEQLDLVTGLVHDMQNERTPWLWPTTTLTITAPTLAQLKAKRDALVPQYRQRGVELLHPEADQLGLLLEQAPGEPWRSRGWWRQMPATTLAGAMPHGTVQVGDDHGPYLGHTSRLALSAVRLDLLTMADRNISPVAVITGKPGSGKSVAAKAEAYKARLRGAWVMYLDPQAETDPLLALPGIGATNVVQLDDQYGGVLDPWTVHHSDRAAAALMATDLARLMLPVVSGDTELALTAASDALADHEAPSMGAFIDALADLPSGKAAADAMRAVSKMKLGQLVFGTGGQRLELDDALTVIRYVGLDLAPTDLPHTEWTTSNRLSAAVLHASAALVVALFDRAPRHVTKLLVSDETHELTRNAAGQGLVQRAGLTIRKRRGAMLLVTQVADHLGSQALLSTVSVVLAFRADSPDEADAVTRLLRRPGDAELAGRLAELGTGECLMRDAYGRVAQVQVDLVDSDLLAAVNTTPTDRATVSA